MKRPGNYFGIPLTAGFTLIELMVALALSLFLVGGVILMYSSGRAAYTDSEQLSRMQENIRFASDYLVRDVRNAGFRDEVDLTVDEWDTIGEEFVTVEDGGDALIIRYGGRGTCAEVFDEFKLVENRYFFNADTGELGCQGRTAGESWSATQGLVSGLTDVAFQLICPDGGGGCTTELTDADAAVGVRIGLEFEGLRDPDNPGDFEQRSVELSAGFRNVILQRIYDDGT